jgi:zinc-ribbon domain
MSIYCPRCGSPNQETTKFCRQCGLALNPVAGYVESGGTAPLPTGRMTSLIEGFTPLQQLWLTIMFFVILPGLVAVIAGPIGLGRLVPIPGVIMPFGILWAIFRYRNQKQRLEQKQRQMQMQMQQQLPQERVQPALRPQPSQHPAISPTNPIATPVRGSVTEDETERFKGEDQ